MLKNKKFTLVISSLIILLPMVFGWIFWNSLPEVMTTHWGIDGQPDGRMGRTFVVFFLPLILLALHWLGIIFTLKDPGNRSQNARILNLMFWILPILSLLVNGVLYVIALDYTLNFFSILNILMGFLFIFLGNYLPKCRRNSTIGIKIKWTLENEENWNATHRFSGRIWFAGGILMFACLLLPESVCIWVTLSILFLLVVSSFVYSWQYHKKQVRQGTATVSPITMTQPTARRSIIFSLILVAVLVVILFVGEVHVTFGDESLTISATFWESSFIPYTQIDSVEYREDDHTGSRIMGFGSPRLNLGAFRNDEFGNYTRYSYAGCDACVVLTSGDKTLVINGSSVRETKAIYDTLMTKLP